MDEYQYSPTPEVNNRKETLQPRFVDHNADVGDMPEIKRRRTQKCWTVLEEETLIKGLEKFGTGNWMAILKTHSDIFEARTNNDLRDKWRNMCRKESWKEMGRSYPEEFAENKDKIAKSDQGLGEHGGEPVFEDLKNVTEAGNGEIPNDKPSDRKENENVNELGEAFEGLENVNKAHNVEILNDNPSSGSAIRIAKSEEVDGDTSMDEYQYSPTPEVNNRKETLQPRLVDHNADVGDMPEIKRRRTRKCWTVMEEETLIKGLEKFGTGNWMAILKTHSDIFEARTNNDLRDKWRNMCRKGVY